MTNTPPEGDQIQVQEGIATIEPITEVSTAAYSKGELDGSIRHLIKILKMQTDSQSGASSAESSVESSIEPFDLLVEYVDLRRSKFGEFGQRLKKPVNRLTRVVPTTSLDLDTSRNTAEEFDRTITKMAQKLDFNSSINTVQLLLTYVDLRRSKFGELPAELQKIVELWIKAPVDRACVSTLGAWRSLDPTNTVGSLTAKMRQSWDAFREELIAASEESRSTPSAEHVNKIKELEKKAASGAYSLLTPEESDAWKSYETVKRLISAGASRFHAGIRTIEDLGDDFNHSTFTQTMRARAATQAQAAAEQGRAKESKPTENKQTPRGQEKRSSVFSGLAKSRPLQIAAAAGATFAAIYTLYTGASLSNRAPAARPSFTLADSDHSEIKSDPSEYIKFKLSDITASDVLVDQQIQDGSEFVAQVDLDQPTDSVRGTRVQEVQKVEGAVAQKTPEKQFSGDYTIRAGEGVYHGINFFLRDPDLRKEIFDNLTKNPNSPEIVGIRNWLQKIGRMDMFEHQVLHMWATEQSERFTGNMIYIGYAVRVNLDSLQLEVLDVSDKQIKAKAKPAAETATTAPAKSHQEKAENTVDKESQQRLSGVQGVVQGLRKSLDLSAFDKQPIDTNVPSKKPTNFDLKGNNVDSAPSLSELTKLVPASKIPQNVSPFAPKIENTAPISVSQSRDPSGVINVARIMDTGEKIRNAESELAPLLQTLSQIPYNLKFKRNSRGCWEVKEGFFGSLFGTKGKAKQLNQFLSEGDVIATRAAELMGDIEDWRVNG